MILEQSRTQANLPADILNVLNARETIKPAERSTLAKNFAIYFPRPSKGTCPSVTSSECPTDGTNQQQQQQQQNDDQQEESQSLSARTQACSCPHDVVCCHHFHPEPDSLFRYAAAPADLPSISSPLGNAMAPLDGSAVDVFNPMYNTEDLLDFFR